MEVKHFSHIHGLHFHQVPQGSEVECSGCKSPASGNTYICWQCSYLLHEHCFRAARSLNHPSHPLHPLTLAPFPTYPSVSFFCDSCNLGGHGFSYTCSECEFDIHLHCALMPNPNPQPQPNAKPQTSIIKHFSHPHALKAMEIEQKDAKACCCCEWEISGSAYTCTEPYCSFILDKACFDSPREVHHKSHPQHPLTLLTAPTNGMPFHCYACWKSGKAFAYACLTCSLTLHVDCIGWAETVAPGLAHDHELTLCYSTGVSCTCNACEEAVELGFNFG